MILHFIYRDFTLPGHVIEHQKEILRQHIPFDFAADSNEFFNKYLETVNNFVSSSAISSSFDESTGQWELESCG